MLFNRLNCYKWLASIIEATVIWIIGVLVFCSRSSGKFLSFHKEIMDAQHFPFYIILSNLSYDPFCSIEIKITAFDRLGFTFV